MANERFLICQRKQLCHLSTRFLPILVAIKDRRNMEHRRMLRILLIGCPPSPLPYKKEPTYLEEFFVQNDGTK